MSWIAIGLIVVGLYFLVVGSIGMLRLPDVFSRAHALSLTDSLGAFLRARRARGLRGLQHELF